MEPDLIYSAITVFALTLISFWFGWWLCSRSQTVGKSLVDELLKANKALQNKLVADSLPGYKMLQSVDSEQNGKNRVAPQAGSGLGPDPFSRGTEADEIEAMRGEEYL